MKFVEISGTYFRPDRIEWYRYSEGKRGTKDIIMQTFGGGLHLIPEKDVPRFLDVMRREQG